MTKNDIPSKKAVVGKPSKFFIGSAGFSIKWDDISVIVVCQTRQEANIIAKKILGDRDFVLNPLGIQEVAVCSLEKLTMVK